MTLTLYEFLDKNIFPELKSNYFKNFVVVGDMYEICNNIVDHLMINGFKVYKNDSTNDFLPVLLPNYSCNERLWDEKKVLVIKYSKEKSKIIGQLCLFGLRYKLITILLTSVDTILPVKIRANVEYLLLGNNCFGNESFIFQHYALIHFLNFDEFCKEISICKLNSSFLIFKLDGIPGSQKCYDNVSFLQK